jgi:hypothetical protein
MNQLNRFTRNTARAACGAALTWLASAACAGPGDSQHLNLTSKAPLRPGVYGKIEVRKGLPPPVVHAQPVTVRPPQQAKASRPVYLYVPPGQLRRWPQHCAKWDACEKPVLFVRVDDSPSRLGPWKKTQRPQASESAVLHALNRFTQ